MLQALCTTDSPTSPEIILEMLESSPTTPQHIITGNSTSTFSNLTDPIPNTHRNHVLEEEKRTDQTSETLLQLEAPPKPKGTNHLCRKTTAVSEILSQARENGFNEKSVNPMSPYLFDLVRTRRHICKAQSWVQQLQFQKQQIRIKHQSKRNTPKQNRIRRTQFPIRTSSCRCTARGRFLGRRGGRVPRIDAKSSAISCLDSATENPCFLLSAAGAGARSAASSSASSDPTGQGGAAGAEWRVRRFHGHCGARWRCSEAPPPSGRWGFSLSGEGVSGAGAGPLLVQRSRRCVPQLRVGKEKPCSRVRDDGGGGGGAG
jgi:hypothetical protein